MLETPHVIVGAAIASKIPNPLISIPLALISHFILDMTPHWNPHLNKETVKYGHISNSSFRLVTIDSTIALLSGLYISFIKLPDLNHSLIIIFASFVSVLPDVVEAPYYFLNLKSKSMERWIKFQKSIQSDATIGFGLFTQITIIVASLWWIYN